METSLLRRKTMIGTDGACVAGSAPELETISSARAAEMRGAGADIIALERESADGARAEARLRDAGVARARAIDAHRQRQALGESERAAVAVPESPLRMDQHTQRRAMHRLRPHRPALERQPRRAAEGIEGG